MIASASKSVATHRSGKAPQDRTEARFSAPTTRTREAVTLLSGDNDQLVEARQLRDDVLGDSVAEILLLRIVAHIDAVRAYRLRPAAAPGAAAGPPPLAPFDKPSIAPLPFG
jgi:hypothetical protein